jgi:hypothetical protein
MLGWLGKLWQQRFFDMADNWLELLQSLASKYTHLGIDTDIGHLSLNELWGLYLHLQRLNES